MSLQIIYAGTFTLEDIEPVSINNLFYGDKRLGWKNEHREWSAIVCSMLDSEPAQSVFNAVREQFDSNIHVLSVAYNFKTPKLFTAAGKISKTSKDVSNCVKALEDIIFTKRFHGYGNYQCMNLGDIVDDSLICELVARKSYAPDFAIEITISILPMPEKAA